MTNVVCTTAVACSAYVLIEENLSTNDRSTTENSWYATNHDSNV